MPNRYIRNFSGNFRPEARASNPGQPRQQAALSEFVRVWENLASTVAPPDTLYVDASRYGGVSPFDVREWRTTAPSYIPPPKVKPPHNLTVGQRVRLAISEHDKVMFDWLLRYNGKTFRVIDPFRHRWVQDTYKHRPYVEVEGFGENFTMYVDQLRTCDGFKEWAQTKGK